MGKKKKTKEKNEIKRKTVQCIDCNQKTDNFYMNSINSGVVFRCADCHEKWILRSVRNDNRFSDVEEK